MGTIIHHALLISVFVSLASPFLFHGNQLRTVDTRVGTIIGHVKNVEFDNKTWKISEYLGIPYAKPPIGNLRFRKPELMPNFTSPFDAHIMGPACPQKLPYYRFVKNFSEDCLHLNIYVPEPNSKSSSPKPVMIWIHGGGFIAGGPNIYVGDVLSAYTDSIIVSFNYRIGPLGFFSTQDKNSLGNFGLWDQNFAIKWVRDNIAAFGGEPSNITIFGESAGSSSVIFQMMYPGSDGLFRRAVAESGTLNSWSYTYKNANYKRSMSFAAYLWCNKTTEHSDIVTCLRNKSTADIQSAVETEESWGHWYPDWVPVFDNEFVVTDPTTFLRDVCNPSTMAAVPSFYKLDLMIGVNSYDGSIYMWGDRYNISRKGYEEKVIPALAESALHVVPTPMLEEAIKFEYTNWSDPDNLGPRLKQEYELGTDCTLRVPSINTAAGHSLKNPNTYMFQFSAAPPKGFGYIPPSLRSAKTAGHSDELPFVWGFSYMMQKALKFNTTDISPEHLKLSKTVMTMWSNFARSGNPNQPRDVKSMYNVDWPPYDVTDQKCLEISPNMNQNNVISGYRARAVAFWNNLVPELLQSTNNTATA